MKGSSRRSARESRSKRRIEALVHRQDGGALAALVTNISTSGCGLRPRNRLDVDEQVRIEIPRLGSVAAEIRWTSPEYAGARFIPHSDVWEVATEGPPGVAGSGVATAGQQPHPRSAAPRDGSAPDDRPADADGTLPGSPSGHGG